MSRRRRASFGLALALAASGCGSSAATPPARAGDLAAEDAPSAASSGHPPPPAAHRAPPAVESGEPAALAGGFGELPVLGFRPAVLFVPPGPRDARFPLAVVMHGAGGRPEPHCERWRHLLRERAYLICPRGSAWGHVPEGAEPSGYFFPEHHTLGKEVVAALGAARATLGPRLDAERALFVGFSQGATMGALFLHELARDPASTGTFGRIAMVEGGTGQWNVALARRLKERGVERALLVCGQPSCARDAEKSEGWMRRAGLAVRHEQAPGAGHTWGGGVGERVDDALPWLLEGDPRF